MIRSALLAASLLLCAGAAYADDITGTWLTADGDAHIRMSKCGPAICGKIVWLKSPKDPNGKPAADVNNHDPAMTNRPLLGLPVAINFRPAPEAPGKLVGEFYNADDGNNYKGHISARSTNELAVEGCLGALCQTQIWTRVK